jgi:ABC-type transport system involved in cytochrome bd biosynthesis fused ATPase/permease subunit
LTTETPTGGQRPSPLAVRHHQRLPLLLPARDDRAGVPGRDPRDRLVPHRQPRLQADDPGASEAEIKQALGRARIWDWIARLPDGIDTLVGEQGSELSGGQRQRIVLARALLADRPVLVLDEPTAHLDPETASELMRDVFAAVGDRTVLLITHRSEGLELVDRVVTLEERAS